MKEKSESENKFLYYIDNFLCPHNKSLTMSTSYLSGTIKCLSLIEEVAVKCFSVAKQWL